MAQDTFPSRRPGANHCLSKNAVLLGRRYLGVNGALTLLILVISQTALTAFEPPPGPMNWALELATVDPQRTGAKERSVQEIAERLRRGAVPTFQEASQIAFESQYVRLGRPWKEPYLYVMAVDVPGFAKVGDLVWEVRFERYIEAPAAGTVTDKGLGGIVWVHVTTKKIKKLFP